MRKIISRNVFVAILLVAILIIIPLFHSTPALRLNLFNEGDN